MKKNGQGSYPIGHIKYGTMGPKTFDEYQSLNFSNRTINKLKRKVSGTGPAGTVFKTNKPITKA
jgi:hypothetical protein|tara:strand:+ start:3121 stop:3312 length:192 start_codon:yes stop_codon:yes gene_type:complete